MTLEELTPWLFARTSKGIRWGLETTTELLAGVDDPHRLFRSVHIGGTNGKGSVAALVDAALREGVGVRVGLYTSPHLVSFAERIRVDGQPVPDEAIVAAAERLRPAIERTGATFFEATTALAFLCFADAGVQVAVVEVGLGGRLDATNVIDPVATAVTNVALEHTDYLGDTVAQIASEKAGIFKTGVPVVTGERAPETIQVLRRRAEEVGAPFHLLDDLVEQVEVSTSLAGTRVRYRSSTWGEGELSVPLPGPHQARNALLALELLGTLPDSLRPAREAIERAFARARWAGRLQVERLGSTTWIFDVAHNPAGVATLVETLGGLDLPRPLVLVTAILSDKPWREMLPPLMGLADGVIVTTAPTAPATRAWDPQAVAEWGRAEGLGEMRVIPDLQDALRRAETLAPHGSVLVTGSVHTVGDAMALLRVEV